MAGISQISGFAITQVEENRRTKDHRRGFGFTEGFATSESRTGYAYV